MPHPGVLSLHPLPSLDAGGVHAPEHLGVRADDGQSGAALLHHPLVLLLEVVGELLKHLAVRLQVPLPDDEVVPPVHDHVLGPTVQGHLGTQTGQRRTLHRGSQVDHLAGLDIQAHFYQKMGVFFQFFLKIWNHRIGSPFAVHFPQNGDFKIP